MHCTERRRYYLTIDQFDASEADEPGNCSEGFHFASLWEIEGPSQLRYDTGRGLTGPDSGSGPPARTLLPGSSVLGWVRSGQIEPAATDNCDIWATNDGLLNGTIANFLPKNAEIRGSHVSCANSMHVWCVEDH